MADWENLPDIILEEIFTFLSPKARHYCSQVCWRWYHTFYSFRVWETFTMYERTLTRRLFHLYKGYERELDPRKAQICFMRVGGLFRRIIVTPIRDFYNLYEFLRILKSFLSFYDEYPMPMLHTFHFTFACATWDISGAIVHGTGGQILEETKELLRYMRNLKELRLNQFLLNVKEVPGLLDAVAKNSTDTLKVLELINCTKEPFPMTDVAQFESLVKLIISPQQLNEEVLLLLAGTALTDLHIVQNNYTCPCLPVSAEAWTILKEMAPHMKVMLKLQGKTTDEILIQPEAPVYAIIYETPYSKLTTSTALQLADFYGKSLEIFAQTCLPRRHGPRSFQNRLDSSLLLLVRQCRKLRTLVVRERLSTASLLILAAEVKQLKLVVRQNGLIKRFDWPRSSDWTDEFFHWLKKCSRSYELTTAEVSNYLGYNWRPLNDFEFKKIRFS